MFHGSIVALVTPMHADGSLDIERLRALVEWHVEQGSDGIVVTGSTGESATLNHQEKLTVLRHVLEQAKDRVPVIAGAGTNATRESIEMTREAMEVGANACLVVTPYYNRPTQEGLYQHFKAIAKSVPIPLILYNVPVRTGCDMQPETVLRLAEITNIIGLKEATAKVERVTQILAEKNGTFDIYSGDDVNALTFMNAGAKGVISIVANMVPKMMHELCVQAQQHNDQKAQELNQKLTPLYNITGIETNPIPTKWALHRMQKIESGIRLPLTPLSKQYQLQVEQALEKVGIFG